PANEWHNEGTILDVRAPTFAPASDVQLNRERASYEERHIRVVGEKPEGKEGVILFRVHNEKHIKQAF
ncbi:MAG: hypothetical protein NC037_06340, partial [Bacteroides sp.]|nr:hypothetical protein [[Eubacterium] siraeum]MCM1456123.1 hypothetical protein [Bacteroides sp.]